MIYLLSAIALLGFGVFSMSGKNDDSFTKYDELFKKYGRINNVPWYWLKAIAMQESDLGRAPSVQKGEASFDGLSYGIMQIAENVGSPAEIMLKGHGGKEKLNDPEYSIRKAAELVAFLKKRFPQSPTKVFLAYNQGEKNTLAGKNYTHPNGRYAEIIKNNIAEIKARQPQEF